MGTDRGHTILLGGVGGDSHSVGLTILRQALLGSGYRVHFLGAQNPLEEVVQLAPLFNVVMISSMDGHTRHYLRDFPHLVRRYRAHGPLWYLGGNLTVGDALGFEQYFREMGFDRVFVKFTDLRQVLAILAGDLHTCAPKEFPPTLLKSGERTLLSDTASLSDDRLDGSAFEVTRREVLQQWKTGSAARDLASNAEFLVRQPSFARVQEFRETRGTQPLIQPRCGVPLVEEQVRQLSAFRGIGVPVLSYQVDSLTRNNNYTGAADALRESRITGVSTMNGFPLVNHGVPVLRKVTAAVNSPLQVRHSTRDPRLLAEISYAGGVTSFEGGPICYNIPYFRDYPLAEAIRNWQYVDFLTALYYDRYGIMLDREYFGPLTATLIPPCLPISIGILQTILAVKQGVRCVSLGYGEGGNRAQDIAAVRMLRQLTREILDNLGYTHVRVSTVFHQYMAAFPVEAPRAEELIYQSAVTAQLSGATRVIVKTPAEAFRIPTMEDNVRGVELVRRGILAAGSERVDEAAVARECELIRREVQAILDRVIYCGAGSIARGIVTAFRDGYLDVPFAPSIHSRGEVVTARDTDGAVRFLSVGKLPFDREVCEFHRDRMSARRHAAGAMTDAERFLLVEHDVLQIPRGEYTSWPLARSEPAQAALVSA